MQHTAVASVLLGREWGSEWFEHDAYTQKKLLSIVEKLAQIQPTEGSRDNSL
jgi:hypothetical protein